MKKPKNRKERINFAIDKLGITTAQLLLTSTDKEVKDFVDSVYLSLKDLESYIPIESTCIRCGEGIIHHTDCGCGYDRAVYNEEDWKDDIESFDISFRRPEDEEFIKNGYKTIN